MPLELIFDNPNSLLVKVRGEDGDEFWLQRRRVKRLKNGSYIKCADIEAAQRRRASKEQE
jgi:hypothetical protein